ncbi:MAG: fumarylacetoacetase [Gemmatimonadota bacterium]|nr:fumarylacetoacetase [Gemmatimonadota bacterium]
MTAAGDRTHDPALRSWVASANAPDTDFPIQNLPFGVFRRLGAGARPSVGVAIGDRIVDLAAVVGRGLVSGDALLPCQACEDDSLNELMALGPAPARAVRLALSDLLREGGAGEAHAAEILVAMRDAELFVPARVGGYTDFYASVFHATNVGSMFRPDNPLLPNYKYIPIGYHGRASSLVASGAAVRRPWGQSRAGDAGPPTFAPSRRLDYELEVGLFVGAGNALGEPIPVGRAEEHVFGLCLVNDWSARDVQPWEYQPLGPFLAKNFATTVSPWVVTLDALAPFRAPAFARPPGDPPPLPYLAGAPERAGIAITLEAWLCSARMRDAGAAPMLVSRGNFTDMYWTIAQLVAHHASNGCNLQPGDLLASGTVSGPTKESRGCLLERTWKGTEPLTLPTGETRAFLEDGDEVVLRGYCERPGAVRIGFGECRGTIAPAIPASRTERMNYR